MADENKDQTEIRRDFHEAVNMPAADLTKWLESEESQSVGQTSGKAGGESIGHESGRRIIELLSGKVADYTDDDYAHMKKVVGYVKRHLAQRPEKDVEHTAWRYSLMNWGHDPLK